MRTKREILIKNIKIGGNNKIAIQSMTNADTLDTAALSNQIAALQNLGCDIVRIAVTSPEEVQACKKIVTEFSSLPLVADIQFDYKIAIACADIGFSKIRFNPGNIGSEAKVKELVSACKSNNVPIRIGVNGGSLEKDILNEYGVTAKALAMSAMRHVRVLENCGFYDIVLSVKSSNAKIMIEANRLLDKECDYPLHIGVTESGSSTQGLLKSAVGIGSLLIDGIGDTIRVSLSDDPTTEIHAAKDILRAVGLDKNYCEIISCPTCSRCKYNMLDIVPQVRQLTKDITKPLKIAVMGCVVNGPGEAKEADFGVAGGKDKSVIFKKGEIVETVENSQILQSLEKLIKEFE